MVDVAILDIIQDIEDRRNPFQNIEVGSARERLECEQLPAGTGYELTTWCFARCSLLGLSSLVVFEMHLRLVQGHTYESKSFKTISFSACFMWHLINAQFFDSSPSLFEAHCLCIPSLLFFRLDYTSVFRHELENWEGFQLKRIEVPWSWYWVFQVARDS